MGGEGGVRGVGVGGDQMKLFWMLSAALALPSSSIEATTIHFPPKNLISNETFGGLGCGGAPDEVVLPRTG